MLNSHKAKLLLCLISVFLYGCASTAPLPPLINIIPPANNLPPDLSAFSGEWEGKWDEALDTVLIVERIDNQKADVILSLGTNILIIINPQDIYWRETAKVINNSTIEWENRNKTKFIFKMGADMNTIEGIFVGTSGGKTLATFHRRESTKKQENVFSIIEDGEWGWSDYEPGNCRNNPHKIRFKQDRTGVKLIFNKPFDLSVENYSNISNYNITNIKHNRITMSLIGETRKDEDGNLVVWDLILDDYDSYYWYRHDWPPENRTSAIEKCSIK